MSPELFAPDKFGLGLTEHSDCYAFGMVIYEVLSGELPFSSYVDYIVIAKVLEGERPERPQGLEGIWFTDDIWSVLEHCWEPVPGNRPSIPQVLRSLKKWMPPSERVCTFSGRPNHVTEILVAIFGRLCSEESAAAFLHDWPPRNTPGKAGGYVILFFFV